MRGRRATFRCWCNAYLDGDLMLDELITQRIALDGINDGFAALRGRQVDPQRDHVLTRWNCHHSFAKPSTGR